MACYSDPTAARALGCINREFERLEKKAKRLYELRREGKIPENALEKAQSQFKGIYRHVLTNVIKEAEEKEKRKEEKPQAHKRLGIFCGHSFLRCEFDCCKVDNPALIICSAYCEKTA